MKKTQMKILLAKLVRWYPKGFPAGMSAAELTARCDDFFEVLGDKDYEIVNEAINVLIKTKTFLPSASEILEAVEAVKAAQTAQEAPAEAWEGEYHYKRVGANLECVGRPQEATVSPRDDDLRAFLEERRRLYAELGAPAHYTLRQIEALAKAKGVKVDTQLDMALLKGMAGGRQ